MGNKQGNNKNIFYSDEQVSESLQGKSSHALLVKTFTWSQDSHGLYDYDNDESIKKDDMLVEQSGTFYRMGNQLSFKSIEEESEKVQPLIRVDYMGNNKYSVIQTRLLKTISSIKETQKTEPQTEIDEKQQQLNIDTLREEYNQKEKKRDESQNHEQSMWLIVRSMSQLNNNNKLGYQLNIDDYLKLGRVRFRVKEINNGTQISQRQWDTDTQQESIKKLDSYNVCEADDENSQAQQQSESSSERNCRFCFQETSTKDNPLIAPCKCQGSIKFIHIKCLQQWLQNKIITKSSQYAIAYIWKNLQCELCHQQYPHKFQEDGKIYPAFEMNKPEGPYLILEQLCKDKDECRGIHIITMNQKQLIKIGRGSDSDMKITDISVSRCHAYIKLVKGKFYLEDQKSKFGTLALIQNGIEISQNTSKIAIQVNKSVFTFYMKKSNNMGMCCTGKVQKDSQNIMLDQDYINKKAIQYQQGRQFRQKQRKNSDDFEDILGVEEEKSQFERPIDVRQCKNKNMNTISSDESRVYNGHGSCGKVQKSQFFIQSMGNNNEHELSIGESFVGFNSSKGSQELEHRIFYKNKRRKFVEEKQDSEENLVYEESVISSKVQKLQMHENNLTHKSPQINGDYSQQQLSANNL